MYPGNLSYIKSNYPTLLAVLETYYVRHADNATSLLLRQSGYGDYAFLRRKGSAAYFSALYMLALHRAAELAAYLGKNQDAARWRGRASTISQAFLDILWDPAAGAFFDRIAPSALTYLSDSNALLYGNAFYNEGGDDLGEAFSTVSMHSYRTSKSQPGLTPLLSTYVLGVKPLRPGFKKWIAKRMPGDVVWARGVVPTPYGPLKVSWKRSGADGDMEVLVHAPEGTNGTVSVPAAPDDAEERRALLNGIAGTAETATGSYINFRVEGGEKHLVSYPQAEKAVGGLWVEGRGGGKIFMPGSWPEALMAVWKQKFKYYLRNLR
ncbi:hypothetical protein DL769_004299 [Monosporascus sp. CRB-8-3]|nr:hypothetical protein DL769_004299 [Monosporascus sp. CRB-8-3]